MGSYLAAKKDAKDLAPKPIKIKAPQVLVSPSLLTTNPIDNTATTGTPLERPMLSTQVSDSQISVSGRDEDENRSDVGDESTSTITPTKKPKKAKPRKSKLGQELVPELGVDAAIEEVL